MSFLPQVFIQMLVTIQLLLLFLLMASGPFLPYNAWWLTVELIGVCLGFWGFWYMSKRGTFRIKPHADEKTILLTEGPYRYIRHPMYAGLFLIILSLSCGSYTFFRSIVSLLLTIILLIKIEIEEVILSKYFPKYKDYKKNTKKIIPFIY